MTQEKAKEKKIPEQNPKSREKMFSQKHKSYLGK